MKIAVLGHSGSGKSTLALTLSELYGIPLLHLDTVQFTDGWKVRDKKEALEIVSQFMEKPDWVIDGNYGAFLRERRLDEADEIIFMDFGRFTCFARALKRYFKYRGSTRDSMSPGCDEKFDLEFAWWILYKGRDKKKREFYRKMCEKYRDKTVVIKNQKELDGYVKSLKVSFEK